MSNTSERINELAKAVNAKSYLEIGVFRGDTFLEVDTPLKIAVDPNFKFDYSSHSSSTVRFYEMTSDSFFAKYPLDSTYHINNSFDIIYIDGLHTFKQSYNDFINSLHFSHLHTIWIFDDTIPCDPWSSIPDQSLSYNFRKYANIPGHPWHGDTYKTVFAIHDFHHDFNYRTIINLSNPQTICWRKHDSSQESSFTKYLERIENLDYFQFLKNIEYANPVFADTYHSAIEMESEKDLTKVYRQIIRKIIK